MNPLKVYAVDTDTMKAEQFFKDLGVPENKIEGVSLSQQQLIMDLLSEFDIERIKYLDFDTQTIVQDRYKNGEPSLGLLSFEYTENGKEYALLFPWFRWKENVRISEDLFHARMLTYEWATLPGKYNFYFSRKADDWTESALRSVGELGFTYGIPNNMGKKSDAYEGVMFFQVLKRDVDAAKQMVIIYTRQKYQSPVLRYIVLFVGAGIALCWFLRHRRKRQINN